MKIALSDLNEFVFFCVCACVSAILWLKRIYVSVHSSTAEPLNASPILRMLETGDVITLQKGADCRLFCRITDDNKMCLRMQLMTCSHCRCPRQMFVHQFEA